MYNWLHGAATIFGDKVKISNDKNSREKFCNVQNRITQSVSSMYKDQRWCHSEFREQKEGVEWGDREEKLTLSVIISLLPMRAPILNMRQEAMPSCNHEVCGCTTLLLLQLHVKLCLIFAFWQELVLLTLLSLILHLSLHHNQRGFVMPVGKIINDEIYLL